MDMIIDMDSNYRSLDMMMSFVALLPFPVEGGDHSRRFSHGVVVSAASSLLGGIS